MLSFLAVKSMFMLIFFYFSILVESSQWTLLETETVRLKVAFFKY